MADYKTPGVYIEEVPAFPNSIAQVETAIPAFIGYTKIAKLGLNAPTCITSLREFEAYFGGPPTPDKTAKPAAKPRFLLHQSVQLFFENGGAACWVTSVGGYTKTFIEKDALLKGLEAINSEDDPTMILIPEAVMLKTQAEWADVSNAMLAQCRARKDRIAILDLYGGDEPMGGSSFDPITTFRDAIHADDLSYGCAYYPWLKLGGTQRSTSTLMPPGPALAGVMARTDASRGVWKAPAGVEASVTGTPCVGITDAEQENLNTPLDGKAINAIRSFSQYGTVVWGARTLDGNSSEWRYVPVRRLMIMLEESITKAVGSFVFEPNDANTWRAIKAMIERFLSDIWRQGALSGTKTDDAYFVQVGLGSTMTQSDISNGRLIVQIGVAPVRPAEFVILQIQQKMQTP